MTDKSGKDSEVDGPEPIERDGQTYRPTSRTFIPARLADNPYLINTGYQAQLDALPEPIRSAVRDGNFMAARADAADQLIPTQWVIDAQTRWREDGNLSEPMTCMALDPAGGGRDSAEIAVRHGLWVGRLITAQGEETADGSKTAATIVAHRRNNCPVVVDVGGGYGGAVTLRMQDNGIIFSRFNGAGGTIHRTRDGSLGFANDRACAYWKLREELDPDQPGGARLALPPDPELLGDLTAVRWKVGINGIVLASKDDIRELLGRSPGKGDAVAMCVHPGNMAAQRFANSGRTPNVLMSHESRRRR
jgi:hypothetical protein